jgi:hypothetical protein
MNPKSSSWAVNGWLLAAQITPPSPNCHKRLWDYLLNSHLSCLSSHYHTSNNLISIAHKLSGIALPSWSCQQVSSSTTLRSEHKNLTYCKMMLAPPRQERNNRDWVNLFFLSLMWIPQGTPKVVLYCEADGWESVLSVLQFWVFFEGAGPAHAFKTDSTCTWVTITKDPVTQNSKKPQNGLLLAWEQKLFSALSRF